MKVLWIVLGVLFGLCLLCAGGGYFFINKARGVFDEAGKFGDESFRAIATSWDEQAFVQRAAPEIEKDNGKDAIPNLIKRLSTGLGPMKTFSSHVIGVNSQNNNGVSATTTNWIADATFEKGSGVVTMELIDRDGKWQILKFDVNSPALIVSPGATGVDSKGSDAAVK